MSEPRWNVTPGRLRFLLVAATLLVFLPGVVGGFLWDDWDLIVNNRYVRELSLAGEALTHDFWNLSAHEEGFARVWRVYYRPVVTLAYIVQYQLFGPDPLGYHLVSLGLHVACVLLSFSWLRRRLGAAPGADLASAAAVALFAVHPARPESVSWISGSTDLWLALWALVALHALDRTRGARGFLLASVALVLALFSKELALVIPVLLATDAALLGRDRLEVRDGLKRAAGLLGVLLVAFALRLLVVPIQRLPAASEGLHRDALRVLSSVGHYALATVWPWPPSTQLGYPTLDPSGHPVYASGTVLLGALVALGFVALGVAARRAPRVRPWLADALWWLVPLAMVSNVLPLGLRTLVAARFLYVPLLGAAALTARALTALGARPRSVKLLAGALCAGLFLAWARTSVDHVGHFLSDEDHWAYEVSLDPGNADAATALARLRVKQRRDREAFSLLTRAYAASEAQHQRARRLALAVDLGTTVLTVSRDADQDTLSRVRAFFDAWADPARHEAVLDTPHARLTVALPPSLSGERFAQSYRLPRAIAYARTGRLSEAEGLLREVLRDVPAAYLAWSNLMLVNACQQRWDEALSAGDRALLLYPGDARFRQLRQRIARARDDLARVPPGGEDRSLVLAEVFLDLGARELARRELAPRVAAHPERVASVLLLVRVELSDDRPEEARRALEGAASRAPGAEGAWREARAVLAARERDPAFRAQADEALARLSRRR